MVLETRATIETATSMDTPATMRVDKWLWAVRLFKTRSLASQACTAGKIKREGVALKASTSIRSGDQLVIPSPDGMFKRQIEVLQLLDKRMAAPIALASYKDHTSQSTLEEAEKKREEKRQQRLLRKEGDQGRLSKKQRRDWRKGLHSYKLDNAPSPSDEPRID